jgi:V8-like Glu-specific endopeptidase
MQSYCTCTVCGKPKTLPQLHNLLEKHYDSKKTQKKDKSPFDTREGERGQKKTQVVEREDKSPEREKDKYRERTSRGKERRI